MHRNQQIALDGTEPLTHKIIDFLMRRIHAEHNNSATKTKVPYRKLKRFIAGGYCQGKDSINRQGAEFEQKAYYSFEIAMRQQLITN